MLLPTHSTLPDIATSGHPASAIVNTPAGNIAATTVQAAINELDSEKVSSTDAALAGSKLYLKSCFGGF